jgi:hypothetical protein
VNPDAFRSIIADDLKRSAAVQAAGQHSKQAVLGQASGQNWTLYHGDACEVVKGIPDASVGLTVSSIPFSGLYIYSDSANDLGNSGDHEEFAAH